jgi:holo-[acyl-carrier protein] synthase
MIVGIGLDVCDIDRMRKSLERYGERFAARILTPAEQAFCKKRLDMAVPLAGRFAAKEATIKALGAPAGLLWHHMEILATENGAPALHLHGVASETAARLAVARQHVTITHDAGVAAAVVILEAEPAGGSPRPADTASPTPRSAAGGGGS